MNPDVIIVPEVDPPETGAIAEALTLFEGEVNSLREMWTEFAGRNRGNAEKPGSQG